MDNFALLLAKSEYSTGCGSADAAELARAAARFQYAAMALVDVENVAAQVRFHEAARSCSIRAITGVELRGDSRETEPRRLVLLARDRAGYESLCRIVSKRRTNRAVPGKDLLAAVDADVRGLFFLSDDSELLGKLLSRGISAKDIRFLLLSPGGPPAPAGIRTVAAVDVQLATPQDRDLHLLQLAIARRVPVHSLQQEAARAIPNPEELGPFDERARIESWRVVEQCDFDLTALRAAPPRIVGPHATTAQEYVEQLCRERLAMGRAQGKWIGPAYDERLAHELEVLRETGFAASMCIAAQIVDRARERNIPMAGRGSAAGSLVANILGVTATDPVANGLLFERFLHRDRIMPPDLDIDLPSGERDLLMEWAIDRFGRERVAQVSAHQTFGRRAAFREGLKALGMGRSRLERFFERFPEDGLELAHSPIPVHLLEGKLRDAVPLLNRLIGRFRHLSVHPGALVFAEPRIDSYSALERAPKGVLVTQYDIHSLEQLGIVKIDLLGNRALSAIQEMTSPPNETRLIPSQDEATLETLRRAETIGCFQIETPPMRAVLRKLPIRSVEDLRNALAIVRPGPGSGEDKASFIRRAHGEESASPPHPRLAGVLHDSLGMLLYEEDVIRAISALTGWTVERADELRRQLLRVDPHEASHLECKFAGAATAAGLAPREARDLWRLLLRFVAYTFNKAHACEYARLAWEMAFLKTHRPLEFSCAVLNHYAGHYPLRTLAADFMRNGARFLLPHVNCAADVCVLEDGAVRIGLGFVKHLTRASLARILLRRPFSDWRDLLERVPLNVREKEALVFSGACDGLAPLDAEAYPYAHEQVMNAIRRDARATSFVIAPFRSSGAHARTFAALVRAHHEMKYLDMHVSDHPLHVLRNEAQREGCTPIANLTAGKRETIAALVAASRRTPAPRGRLMQFVTFEDETGLVEATLLPETFLRLEDPIRNPGPYLVEGRGEEDHGQLQWIVSEVRPFFERSRPYEDE